MNTRNPYIIGAPVGNTKVFVGRDDILRELLDVVNSLDKNAIVLYGQRRIGKTSVLQSIENTLQEKKHRVVNFDLMGKAKEPFGKVWAELEKRIRDQFNQSAGSHYEPQPFLDWLSTTLSEDNEKTSLVLLLDEFDALEEWEQPEEQQAINELFPRLRKLLDQRKNFKCVFTIGRDIKHLSSKTFSQLNDIPTTKVSLLEKDQVVQLINLSKEELNWTPEAITEVERLTNGQAYCVQLLCSQIWQHFYSENRPTISLQNVETVIPKILSPAIFSEDIWEGLPAAGKVIASVLSEFDGSASIEQLLEKIRERGGIANVIQDNLETVPTLLVQWDLIELAGDKYKFKVELIRRYIKGFKPFDKMQPELDRLTDYAADDLYKTACTFAKTFRKDDAIKYLNDAIKFNPQHIKANKLLAQTLKEQGKLKEARKTLEDFYRVSPHAAKPLLTNVLLALAKNSKRDKDKLGLYQEILKLDPNHSEAKEQLIRIEEAGWRHRIIEGMFELTKGMFELTKGMFELTKGFIEWAKKSILTYQKQIAQVTFFVLSLVISYFLPVGFPPGLLFEIGKTNDNDYQLISVPSSKSHSLAFIQMAIDNPNVQPKEASFKYENYKPVVLMTPLTDTETPTYQIDSALLKLKENTFFQYPFFEQDKSTPLPFIFAFQFDNNITQNVEFKCKAKDGETSNVGCEVRPKGYGSLLRGIPWWMIGTLLGILLVIFIEIGYAIKDREPDDVL